MFDIVYFDAAGDEQTRDAFEFCAVRYNGQILAYSFTEDRCIDMISDFLEVIQNQGDDNALR
jgi:hypothetical protein